MAGVIGVSIRSKLSFIRSCVVAGKEEENPCVWILASTLLNKSWRQNLDGNEMIEREGESTELVNGNRKSRKKRTDKNLELPTNITNTSLEPIAVSNFAGLKIDTQI